MDVADAAMPPEASALDVPAREGSLEPCVGEGASSCGAGRECRLGVCCALSAGAECPPGAIGSPCTTAMDCVRTPGAAILCYRGAMREGREEYPQGYCTAGCDRAEADPCGPLGVCVVEGLFSACGRRCTVGSACREGYFCRVYTASMSRVVPVCLPDCTAGALCGSGKACYLQGRYCLQACSRAMDPACFLQGQCSVADGVCLEQCLLGRCPAGTVCGAGNFCRAP